MGQGRLAGFRPRVEWLEGRRPLSAGGFAGALTRQQSAVPVPVQAAAVPGLHAAPAVKGVTLSRITNPTPTNAILRPPFQHVLVQGRQPVPGQVYNLLFITVYNGTKRTFTAADGLAVKISNQTPGHAYPILTGTQQWRPGDRIVFYLMTKQYYPLSPVESAGFQFNFVNSPQVVAIPGPSGIFLRVRYNPATFDRVLDTIVVSGPGSRGTPLGLPNTSIWQILPAAAAGVPL